MPLRSHGGVTCCAGQRLRPQRASQEFLLGHGGRVDRAQLEGADGGCVHAPWALSDDGLSSPLMSRGRSASRICSSVLVSNPAA